MMLFSENNFFFLSKLFRLSHKSKPKIYYGQKAKLCFNRKYYYQTTKPILSEKMNLQCTVCTHSYKSSISVSYAMYIAEFV